MHIAHSTLRQSPDIRAAVGNTPVVRVSALDTGPCDLFLKLESKNPGGSIKDRVGRAMIQDAEMRGILTPGTRIIEGTSGNTGIGLALAAIPRGYGLTLVIPDRVSPLKIAYCKALGADVVLTRSDVPHGHPEHFCTRAEILAQCTPGSVHLNQFTNEANARAHEEGTGPEIFAQLNGEIDAIVVGVGSGGTLTGLSRFFKRVSPKTEIILADPMGSIIDQVRRGIRDPVFSKYLVEGVGSDFVPPLLDLTYVSSAYSVADLDSLATCRLLARLNGILAGTSSGVLAHAALQYCREQTTRKRVATFVCDTGERYLSKIFGDGY